MGSIVVEAILKGKINHIRIEHTLYVLNCMLIFLSVSQFVSNDVNVQFNLNESIIKSYNDKAIAIAPRQNNLCEINFIT